MIRIILLVFTLLAYGFLALMFVIENLAWNFKFILLVVPLLAGLTLYLTNTHARILFLRTPAIVLCGIWGILNIVFVISGLIRKDIFNISPVAGLLHGCCPACVLRDQCEVIAI